MATTVIPGRAIVDAILNRAAPLDMFIEAGMDLDWINDPFDRSSYYIFDDSSHDHYRTILENHKRYDSTISVEDFQRSYPPEVYRIQPTTLTPYEILDRATAMKQSAQVSVKLNDAVRHSVGQDTAGVREALEMALSVIDGEVESIDHEEAVLRELAKIRIRKEAELRYAMAENDDEDVIASNCMSEPELDSYRVNHLFPENSYLMISAQRKRGKTTILGNLMVALVDGGHFLDEFKVDGRNKVMLLDTEMPENKHKNWLKTWGIFNHPRLLVGHYNGRAGVIARMLFNKERRAKFIQHLQENEIDILIIDPIGPIFRALGVDENSADVSRVVDAIKEIVREAGVSELIITHHQGKDASKGARGHSSLVDTPDAFWELTGPGEVGSDKLTSIGRDSNRTVKLYFDLETKTYSALTDGDETSDVSTDDLVYAHLVANSGKSGTWLYDNKPKSISMNKSDFFEALNRLKGANRARTTGNGNQTKWEAI